MGTIIISGGGGSRTVGKIFCVGRNYSEHAGEMKAEIPSEPVIFLKPPSAIIHPPDPVVRPAISKEMHHEAELVVALGAGGRNIPEKEAASAILGYGVGLDMTLRDVQSVAKKKGLPWTVAKGFDTSAPVSEIIPAEPSRAIPVFELYCRVNGHGRQRAQTSAMLFTIPFLIHYLSTIFTLEEGDLIFTGTPAGVGVVHPGDTIEAGLAGTVSIEHPVTAA